MRTESVVREGVNNNVSSRTVDVDLSTYEDGLDTI